MCVSDFRGADSFLLLEPSDDDRIVILEQEIRELRERCVGMHGLLLQVLDELNLERASKSLLHILTELEDDLAPS